MPGLYWLYAAKTSNVLTFYGSIANGHAALKGLLVRIATGTLLRPPSAGLLYFGSNQKVDFKR